MVWLILVTVTSVSSSRVMRLRSRVGVAGSFQMLGRSVTSYRRSLTCDEFWHSTGAVTAAKLDSQWPQRVIEDHIDSPFSLVRGGDEGRGRTVGLPISGVGMIVRRIPFASVTLHCSID